MSKPLRAFKWTIPPPRPFDGDELRGFSSFVAKRSDWCNTGLQIENSFGLELRQSYQLLELHRTARRELPDFVERKLRRLFMRPAVEPILFSYREILRSATMSVQDAVALAGALCGHPVDFRTGPMSGEANGRLAIFENHVDPREGLAEICSADLADIGDAAAFYIFAKIIALHPFRDGNGRFARAMAAGALWRGTDPSSSIMPLGPAFYVAAPEIASGLEAACRGKGWSSYHRAMLDACTNAVRLAKACAGNTSRE